MTITIAIFIGICVIINSLIIFYAVCKLFLNKEDSIRKKNFRQ